GTHRDHRLGLLRPRQGSAVRELHGALRLRAVRGARHDGIAAGVAARDARDLTWPGPAWPGLSWPGLGWPGLGWAGPGWPGPGRRPAGARPAPLLVHVTGPGCIVSSDRRQPVLEGPGRERQRAVTSPDTQPAVSGRQAARTGSKRSGAGRA